MFLSTSLSQSLFHFLASQNGQKMHFAMRGILFWKLKKSSATLKFNAHEGTYRMNLSLMNTHLYFICLHYFILILLANKMKIK